VNFAPVSQTVAGLVVFPAVRRTAPPSAFLPRMCPWKGRALPEEGRLHGGFWATILCARHNGGQMNGIIGEIKPVADVRARNSKPLGLILFTKIEDVVSDAIKFAIPGTSDVEVRGLQNYQDFYCTFVGVGLGTVVLLRRIDGFQPHLVEDLSTALTLGILQPINSTPSALNPFVCVATAQAPDFCTRDLLNAFHLRLSLRRYSETDLTRFSDSLAREVACFARTAKEAKNAPRQTLREPSQVDISRLSGIEFEWLIGTLLQRMGYSVEVTKPSGDGGIDIVAALERPITGGRYLIQCKRFAPGSLVGSPTVRDFYGALAADLKAMKGVLITTSGFTDQAREFASGLRIELIDGEQLQRLCSEFGETGRKK